MPHVSEKNSRRFVHIKCDFDGFGWDGLMFGASAMWFDSGAFDDNSVFAFVDQHVGNACLLPWRVPAEVWKAGVCVNRECFVFLVRTNKNVGLLFFELQRIVGRFVDTARGSWNTC